MSVIKDTISAMREVLLLTSKVEDAGEMLSDISKELREHDRRIVRIETFIEIAEKRMLPKQ